MKLAPVAAALRHLSLTPQCASRRGAFYFLSGLSNKCYNTLRSAFVYCVHHFPTVRAPHGKAYVGKN